MPQTKLQKIRPMNMATSFVRAARLVSHGVSNHPSRLVITTDTPATDSAIAMVKDRRLKRAPKARGSSAKAGVQP